MRSIRCGSAGLGRYDHDYFSHAPRPEDFGRGFKSELYRMSFATSLDVIHGQSRSRSHAIQMSFAIIRCHDPFGE
jgi:hypothetical protein